MHPVLIARGPAFKRNYTTSVNETIKIVDIYDLMCFILDLEPITSTNGSFNHVKCLLDDNYLIKKDLEYYLDDIYYKKFVMKWNRVKKFLIRLESINNFLFDILINLLKKLTNYIYVFILTFILICFILIVMRMKSWHFNQSYPLIQYRPLSSNFNSPKVFILNRNCKKFIQ
jgi:hypothetical protein